MVVRKDKQRRTWIIDLSLGENLLSGKRKRIVRKGFQSKKEAQKAEKKLYQIFLSDEPNYDHIRIQEFFNHLMREDENNQRKPSYIRTQKYNYNRHLKPYFQGSLIVQLKYEHIFEFREYLCTKGLSNNTVNKIMILLKRILDVGIRKGYMSDNPCTLLKKLPTDSKRMNFWTLEEFHEFRQLFTKEEKNYLIFFTLAFFTGMRSGELLGLTWEDFNFFRREIYVHKNLTKVDGKFIFNTPKTTAGKRIIIINRKLVEDLKAWKKTQYAWLSKEMSLTKEAQEKIQVVQKDHLLLHKDNVRKKYDAIFRRPTELKKIRIHDFRHSHVALLINNGEDPYMIKKRIGHASIQTIYDLYGHLYPSKQLDTADRLDQFY